MREGTDIEKRLELEHGAKFSHPFAFCVAGVGVCNDFCKMAFEPVRIVWAGDDAEGGEDGPEVGAEGVVGQAAEAAE